MFSFHLRTVLGVELLDLQMGVFSILRNCQTIFKVVVLLQASINNV